MSDQSGQNQVYVQSFPEGGRVIPISTGLGTEAVWSRNGRELFYRNGNQVLVVDVEVEPEFTVDRPRVLFEGRYEPDPTAAGGNPNDDVSLDGQNFLMVGSGRTDEQPTLAFVQNWHEELKRLVPVN